MCNKRVYPQWFIDELVNEDCKERARNGELKTNERISFKCEKGHIYDQEVKYHIILSSCKKKHGCPICTKEKNRITKLTNKKDFPKWFIDELVNENDKIRAINKTLSLEDKVELRCNSCGNNYIKEVNHRIKRSNNEPLQGCPVCKINDRNNKLEMIYERKRKQRFDQQFIDELMNEEDKEKARNGKLKLNFAAEFKCKSCGNIYRQVVKYHLDNEQNCPICIKKKRGENVRSSRLSKRNYPKWFINDLANESDRIKALNHDLSTTDEVEFICNNGHTYKQIVGNHIRVKSNERKNNCPICTNLRSKSEIEIEKYIESLGYKTEHRRFRSLDGKYFELDIFIPEKNIAIEYNGNYYHKSFPLDGFCKDKDYHYNKYIACQKLNIHLISIFEENFKKNRENILSLIQNILDDNCEIKDGDEIVIDNNYEDVSRYKIIGYRVESYIEDSYTFRYNSNVNGIVYTCGYTKLIKQ